MAKKTIKQEIAKKNTSAKKEPSYEEESASMLYKYPTKRDKEMRASKEQSDSANYVKGYRGEGKKKFWPSFSIDSPYNSGYYAGVSDRNDSIPSFTQPNKNMPPRRPVKKDDK